MGWIGSFRLTYTLLCIKQVTDENRLYSTRNSSVFCGDPNGKEIQKRGDVYVCVNIADVLSSVAETNTCHKATIGSVQFSRSVVSNSLQSHELQHARPPCPSPTPGVYSNSCLSSWICHPTTLSSVLPFSSCPQSLPASGSFPMSQLFT